MAPKRKTVATDARAGPGKVQAQAVECEFCGKTFKSRGLKLHRKKCPQQRSPTRTPCFESLDSSVLANLLSYLGNQSIVKLQSITGAHYPGSNVLTSAICCSCENDELAVANGLCCACNKENDSKFRETITTTDARRLYGIHDICSVAHDTHTVRRRGFYCLFKYDDLDRFAQRKFGRSWRCWRKRSSADGK